MQLLPADYALCALAVAMAVTGLFRGFSGTLAFALACVAGGTAGIFGWDYSAELTQVVWMRGGGTLVFALLAFGLVRILVRKLVGGLLAQPSDALFGMLTGVAIGVMLPLAWGYAGIGLEYSNLAAAAADYVR